MGDGFVVVATSSLEFYYYQDEPGTVSSELERQDPSADYPCWGSDLKLDKGTIFSYGPWADKQRDYLYRLLYPNEYQLAEPTVLPSSGEQRIAKSFDMKISTLSDATLDVLFSKNDITNAIHFDVKPGTYMEICVPWIMKEDGFLTTIEGQLMRVESSTSIIYRPLLSCETLEFKCELHYPLSWNERQDWRMSFTGCRSTLYFIFEHKYFLNDLVNDWSSTDPMDLYEFAPYNWAISATFKDYELVLVGNQHNWIDTSSHDEENARIALCGKVLDLSFSIPFSAYRMDPTSLRFDVAAECLLLRFCLPEGHTMREPLGTLFAHAYTDTHGASLKLGASQSSLGSAVVWRSATSGDDWHDVWMAPLAGSLVLNYTFHPNPVSHGSVYEDFAGSATAVEDFDPTTLAPDTIDVEVELSPSVVKLNGMLIRLLFYVKENYLGEFQNITDFATFKTQEIFAPFGHVDAAKFNPLTWRPLHVMVSAVLHELQVHCLMMGKEGGAHCPQLFLEQFSFEMDKRYQETMLQLALSPVVLHTVDAIERSDANSALCEGQLILSALQLRGHGMFSNQGLPIDGPTAEYAWLIELLLGELTGRLTLPQFVQIIQFLETFIFMATNDDDVLPAPKSLDLCHHMFPLSHCPETPLGEECFKENVLKYKMTRLAFDAVDIFLVEGNSAVEFVVTPVRLSHCTLHKDRTKGGFTIVLPEVRVAQFVMSDTGLSSRPSAVRPRLGSEAVPGMTSSFPKGASLQNWLECGRLQFCNLSIEVTLPQLESRIFDAQIVFLRLHDAGRKYLSFLWRDGGDSDEFGFTCGCRGGCRFFGQNKNGSHFFDPRHIQERLSHVTIVEDSETPGFGQSIIRSDEPILSFRDVPDGASGDSGTTVLHHSPQRRLSSRDIPGRGLIDVDVASQDQEFFEARENFGSFGESTDDEVADEAVQRRARWNNAGGSVARSSVESFVSTATEPEESMINLYGQLNRPVFNSPMLMASYNKFLNSHACANWNAIPPLPHFVAGRCLRSKCGSTSWRAGVAPDFVLVEPGLNELRLVRDLSRDGFETINENEEDSRIGDASVADAAADTDGGPEPRVGNRQPVKRLEVVARIRESVSCFVSPLGAETIGRFLTSVERQLTLYNCMHVLQKGLSSCSSRNHSQLLTVAESDSNVPPFRFEFLVPRIELSIFQCGVVEKIVPFSKLEQIQNLSPSSVLLGVVDQITFRAATVRTPPPSQIRRATKGAKESTKGESTRPISPPVTSASSEPQKEVHSVVGSLRIVHTYFQLHQVTDKTSSIIGISRNASRIPYAVNWESLEIANDYSTCLVAEGGIRYMSIRGSVELGGAWKDIDSRIPSRIVGSRKTAAVGGSAGCDSAGNSEPAAAARPRHPSSRLLENSISLNFGDFVVNFGLCIPPDEVVDQWPLYDVLTPSLSAWIHVVHRLTARASLLKYKAQSWQELSLSYLLTESWHQPRCYSLPKAKYGQVKRYHERFRCCPTCQMIHAMYRFASANPEAVLQSETAIAGCMEESVYGLVQKGVVALLTHWRTVLVSEEMVFADSLPTSIRDMCQRPGGASAESYSDFLGTLSSDNGVDGEDTSALSDEGEEENTPLLSRDDSSSLQNLMARMQNMSDRRLSSLITGTPTGADPRSASTVEMAQTAGRMEKSTAGHDPGPKKGSLGGQGTSLGSTVASPQHGSRGTAERKSTGERDEASGGLNEDLYSWLAREQRSHRNRKETAERNSSLQQTVVTPGDAPPEAVDVTLLPISVYFEPIFHWLRLETVKKSAPMLFARINFKLVFSFLLESASVSIVEPKILKSTNAAIKRISHAERPVLNLQELSLTADAVQKTTSKMSPKSRREMDSVVRNINYHAHLARSACNFGFSTAAFFNQMILVGRTTYDIYKELKGVDQSTTESLMATAPMGNESVAASSGASTVVASESNPALKADTIAPSPDEMEISLVEGIPKRKMDATTPTKSGLPSVNLKFRKKLIAASYSTTPIASPRQESTESPYQPENWNVRFMDMIAQYQRMQKLDPQRNALDRQLMSSAEPALVSVTFGVIDVVEFRIQATMTELVVFVSVSSVQLGHSAKEKVLLISKHVQSGEMSVTSAVQKVTLNLSESRVPSIQTVVHMSIDQSQVLFTRAFKKRNKDWKNSLLLEIGPVAIDVPLNPGLLHGVVVRGTKSISETLKDLRTPQVVEEVVQVITLRVQMRSM